MLGRLDPDNFLGGTMKLDAEGARRGIKDKIADPLKLDTVAAAQAIVDIAVNKMSLAVREVSVAKGYDPRDFALVASGGAGPLHVCAIARELYIPTVIVPLFPSHFSALGMLLADERHDFTRTVYSDLASVDFGKLVAVHDEMVKDAKGEPAPRQERGVPDPSRPALHGPGVHAAGAGRRSSSSRRATARPSAPRSTSCTSMRYAHHSPEEPVEMVNIRLGAIGKRPKLSFPSLASAARAAPAGEQQAYFTRRQQAAHRQGLQARGARRGRARSPGPR